MVTGSRGTRPVGIRNWYHLLVKNIQNRCTFFFGEISDSFYENCGKRHFSLGLEEVVQRWSPCATSAQGLGWFLVSARSPKGLLGMEASGVMCLVLLAFLQAVLPFITFSSGSIVQRRKLAWSLLEPSTKRSCSV